MLTLLHFSKVHCPSLICPALECPTPPSVYFTHSGDGRRVVSTIQWTAALRNTSTSFSATSTAMSCSSTLTSHPSSNPHDALAESTLFASAFALVARSGGTNSIICVCRALLRGMSDLFVNVATLNCQRLDAVLYIALDHFDHKPIPNCRRRGAPLDNILDHSENLSLPNCRHRGALWGTTFLISTISLCSRAGHVTRSLRFIQERLAHNSWAT